MRAPICSNMRNNNQKLTSTVDENFALQEEIRELEGDKLSSVLKAKEKLKKMEITLEENKLTITNLHREMEIEENQLKSYTMAKINNLQNLNKNIESISSEIDLLKSKLQNNKSGELILVSKKKEKYIRNLSSNNKKIRKIKYRLNEINELELNAGEMMKMLQEDIFSCKNDLINFISKKESHLEYVKSLMNSKQDTTESNCNSPKSKGLSCELGGTVACIEEIRRVSLVKFVDLLYENSNSNFKILIDKQAFLQRVVQISIEDFENQIIKEITANSKSNMTSFDLENVVKSLIKTLYYEKIIDVRMLLLDKLTQNAKYDPCQMNLTREKERLLDKYASKVKKCKEIEKKIQNITKRFDPYLNEDDANLNSISISISNSNFSNIQQMENDLEEMIRYKEAISREIEIDENRIACIRGRYIDEINTIQLTNEEILGLIEQLQDKIQEDSNRYDEEIEIRRMKIFENNALVKTFMKVTDDIHELNLSQLSQRNFNSHSQRSMIYSSHSPEDNCDDNLISAQSSRGQSSKALSHLEFFYNPKTTSKEDVIICEKISPLLTGTVVYKRSTFNLNTNKSLSEYNGTARKKFAQSKDGIFKKFFLVLDKKMAKLIFNKMKEEEKSFELCLTSISKIEIPIVTKSLIFIKQVYNSLLSKKNALTSKEINDYFTRNADKLTILYNKGVDLDNCGDYIGMDEKILNEDYRETLVKASQYLMYIYLKPDDDVRVDVILSTYEEFKHWLNGLEELLKNGSNVKKIVNKKLLF